MCKHLVQTSPQVTKLLDLWKKKAPNHWHILTHFPPLFLYVLTSFSTASNSTKTKLLKTARIAIFPTSAPHLSLICPFYLHRCNSVFLSKDSLFRWCLHTVLYYVYIGTPNNRWIMSSILKSALLEQNHKEQIKLLKCIILLDWWWVLDKELLKLFSFLSIFFSNARTHSIQFVACLVLCRAHIFCTFSHFSLLVSYKNSIATYI